MLEKVMFSFWVGLLTLLCSVFIFCLGFFFHGYPLGESLAYTVGTMIALPLVILVSLKIWSSPRRFDRSQDTG